MLVLDHWDVRGEMVGGGPFLTEDRVVPLNLDGVEGDSVRILLTPPAGFWQINWCAMDNSPDTMVTPQELSRRNFTCTHRASESQRSVPTG